MIQLFFIKKINRTHARKTSFCFSELMRVNFLILLYKLIESNKIKNLKHFFFLYEKQIISFKLTKLIHSIIIYVIYVITSFTDEIKYQRDPIKQKIKF